MPAVSRLIAGETTDIRQGQADPAYVPAGPVYVPAGPAYVPAGPVTSAR